MKFNFFEKAKKAAEIGAAAVILTGATAQEASAVKPADNVKNIKMATVSPDKLGAETLPAGTVEFSTVQKMMENSSEYKLKIAEETMEGMIKGVPFVSKLKPGFIGIPSELTYVNNNTNKDQYGASVNYYEINENETGGYVHCSSVVEAKENPEKLLEGLKSGRFSIEANTLKVETENRPTNLSSLAYKYNLLREKLSPLEVQKLLEEANPGLNRQFLVSALDHVLKGVSDNFDAATRAQIASDLKVFSQGQ